MPDEEQNDDVLVMKPQKNETSQTDTETYETLQALLEQEKQNNLECNDKLKYALADYQNLFKKTQSDIENGINAKMAAFMVEFLKIYDDLERAKQAFSEQNMEAGLNSILKNIDVLLAKYGIKPIDALGEIFDPKLHEAISITQEKDLDDDAITKEIRKGYILHDMIIRPSLVEISKKGEKE